MEENIFVELKQYVGFGPEDEAALRALRPLLQLHYDRIAHTFYERILQHEGARQALQGGESRVGHLKVTLVKWMDELCCGPWDDTYFQKRSQIGRVHVRISLPQHYMFGAMNLLREEFNAVVDAHYLDRPRELSEARSALGKILDLELAIMLHTYREDLLAQAARNERLSTFGQLVGSIGHELRNPLGVIETSVYILKGRPLASDERAAKHLGRIGEQVEVANRIVTDLLDMIRDRPLQRERVRLEEVWRATVATVPRPEGVVLSDSGLSGLPEVDGDAVQLRQVFANLLENAYQASAPEGRVRLEGGVEQGSVWLALEDSGPGVDPTVRHRLFEPLITTKAKGVGLGLALVKRIMERHGGTVTYAPRAGAGARFLLTLPVPPP